MRFLILAFAFSLVVNSQKTTAAELIGLDTGKIEALVETEQSADASNSKAVQPSHRTIHEGIGLSFSMTPDEAKNRGFNDWGRHGSIERAGQWVKGGLFSVDDFWAWKQIQFTPVSHQVYSFSGDHYFKGYSVGTDLECLSDYRLVLGKLKDKYPLLNDVSNPRLQDPPTYFSSELCENEKHSTATGIIGSGRCIRLLCAAQRGAEGKFVGALLKVTYIEPSLYETLAAERKEYRKLHQDKLLLKRGISPNDL